MTKSSLIVIQNFFILSVLLPFVYGCQGGGGAGSASVGSLFNSFAGSGGAGSVVGGSFPGGETGVATIVNPEPTTLLLMGSGIAAMRFLSGHIKK